MSDRDDKSFLVSVARRVSTRLANLPPIAGYLDRERFPYEADTNGWGIRIARIGRLNILLFFDGSWQRPTRTLWAGFGAASASAFAPILEASNCLEIPRLSESDTRWWSESMWGFKDTVTPPKDFVPIFETYGDQNYLGIYCFNPESQPFIEKASSFLTLSLADIFNKKIIYSLKHLKRTERKAVIHARVGQGAYRENVRRIESACRITGVSEPSILRASHMKPWSLCENARERLDGNNGLLLTPTYDVMFDRGYLTFDTEGRPIRSSLLSKGVIEALSMPDPDSMSIRPFSTRQKKYLAFHRNFIFKP